MLTELNQGPVEIAILMTRNNKLEPFTIEIEDDNGAWEPDGGIAQIRRSLNSDSELIKELDVSINGSVVTVAGDYPTIDVRGVFYWDICLWDSDRRITYAQGQFIVGDNVSQEILGP